MQSLSLPRLVLRPIHVHGNPSASPRLHACARCPNPVGRLPQFRPDCVRLRARTGSPATPAAPRCRRHHRIVPHTVQTPGLLCPWGTFRDRPGSLSLLLSIPSCAVHTPRRPAAPYPGPTAAGVIAMARTHIHTSAPNLAPWKVPPRVSDPTAKLAVCPPLRARVRGRGEFIERQFYASAFPSRASPAKRALRELFRRRIWAVGASPCANARAASPSTRDLLLQRSAPARPSRVIVITQALLPPNLSVPRRVQISRPESTRSWVPPFPVHMLVAHVGLSWPCRLRYFPSHHACPPGKYPRADSNGTYGICSHWARRRRPRPATWHFVCSSPCYAYACAATEGHWGGLARPRPTPPRRRSEI
ncbi:hypothetical protein C8Q79DRAFT_655363 [Trametes meyenii]|nr:hypothetical protein C8Q79DRAFT_655363 [Trametes meyenii]